MSAAFIVPTAKLNSFLAVKKDSAKNDVIILLLQINCNSVLKKGGAFKTRGSNISFKTRVSGITSKASMNSISFKTKASRITFKME